MDKSIKKLPLRVCILTNIPAPYRLPVFEKLGESIELTVFYCQGSTTERKWTTKLNSENVENVVLTSQLLPFIPKTFIYNPDLKAILKNEPFDIYIAGENFDTAVSVITLQKAAQRQNKPFILWSEAIDTNYASGNIVSNTYRKWLYTKTDYFLAYSEMAKNYLLSRGVSAKKINRGYQIVPSEQLPPTNQTKKDAGLEGKTVILYLGYFESRKGLDLLISAFKKINGNNYTLLLIGDGPQKDELQSLASEDKRIQFIPYAEGVEKSNWYNVVDIFILPTQHDPWGLVVNEAMMVGLPIITTDAAAVSELISENGIVIPANDETHLKNTLQKLINEPELRLSYGQKSRQIIASYDVDRAAKAFLDVINLVQKLD